MYIVKCRMCESKDLQPFLNLGYQPPADGFLTSQDEKEFNFPLEVVACKVCGLVQLSYVVPPEALYCNDYPYDASTAKTARDHWHKFAEEVEVKAGDLVVDIGSNVGVLLQAFKDRGAKVFGVDPAKNIVKIANANGIETAAAFFDSRVAAAVQTLRGEAELITGTNVFAHVHDLKELMHGVTVLLSKTGTFVIEVPYFCNLVEKLQYDTIYHEHLSYISIKPLAMFFEKCNMHISNIVEQDFHGGSIRVFVKRGKRREQIVDEYIAREEKQGIYNIFFLLNFAAMVKDNRFRLQNLVAEIKKDKKSIAVVSAPAKGMTLLNYCKFGREELDFVTEKAPLKIGKFTPGSHLPVLPDSALIERNPDYAILLAWNFADEIIKNNKDFKGKFIIPIPFPKVA